MVGFADVLRQDKDSCYELDKDRYDWIWGGNVLQLSDTLIYKNKFVVEQFETPKDSIFYCGLDFGATHPTAATRCFIDTNNNILYIDAEAGEPCTDNDELPKLVDKILPHKRWPLYCDSEDKKGWMKLKQLGYNAQPVKKGPNSVIDGIMFLRGFSKIVVHPRCVQTINEFKRYSWKVDPYTQQTLPVPIKNYDHFLDSIRYALETVALNTHLSHKQWMKFIGTNNK